MADSPFSARSRLLVPPGVAAALTDIGRAIDRGKDHLRYETDQARRHELEQLIDRAKRWDRKAVNALLALGPAYVYKSRSTPEEAYQKQQRENAAALAVTRVHELYNSVVNGDPKAPQTVPFDLAKRHRLFPNAISAIEQAVTEKDRPEQEQRLRELQDQYHERVRRFVALRQKIKQGRVECVRQELSHWKFHCRDFMPSVDIYVPFLAYPSVQQVLAPYYTACFAPPWRDLLPRSTKLLPGIVGHLQRLREENARQRKKAQEYVKNEWVAYCEKRARYKFYNTPFRDYESIKYSWHSFEVCFQDFVLDAFQKFLEQYGEGAIVTLVLLITASSPMLWRDTVKTYPNPKIGTSDYWQYVPYDELYMAPQPLPQNWRSGIDYERYPGFNTLYLPTLVNREPLEILLVLERINEVLSGRDFAIDCAKYYWIGEEGEPQPHRYHWLRPPVYLARINPYDIPEKGANWWGYSLPKTTILVRNTYQKGVIQSCLEKREDLQLLRKKLYAKREWPRWYVQAEGLVRTYLQCRACDIARYGEQIADLTFPLPTIRSVAPKAVSDMVATMTAVLKEEATQKDKEEDAIWITRYQKEMSENYNLWLKNRTVSQAPAYLPPQVLSENEIEALKAACRKELGQSEK